MQWYPSYPSVTEAVITLNNAYQQLNEVFGWTIRGFYTCNAYALEAACLPPS